MDYQCEVDDENAISLAFDYLRGYVEDVHGSSTSSDDIHNAICKLESHDMMTPLYEFIKLRIQDDIATTVYKDFYRYFSSPPATHTHALDMLSSAFQQLKLKVCAFECCLRNVEYVKSQHELITNNPVQLTYRIDDVLSVIKSVLLTHDRAHFLTALEKFFFCGFQCNDNLSRKFPVSTGELDCSSCTSCGNNSGCSCEELLKQFHVINNIMRELKLLDTLSGEFVTLLLHERITTFVEESCKGVFDSSQLELLEEWLGKKLDVWIGLLYEPNVQDQTVATKLVKTSSTLQILKDRLFYHLYQEFAKVRIGELFNIIIDHPESEPTLRDLRVCLEKVQLRPVLVQQLRNAMETRLLHPGVNTTDILTFYVSAIRSLRLLDPPGVLLDLTCELVHQYLRRREDTVRCIVASLTEESSGDLTDELGNMQSILMDDDEGRDSTHWRLWTPDPVDAGAARTWRSRNADIISMLVNIYGSKDMFVKEYQLLLKERILANITFDADREIRYLELLKVKFGDSDNHLHNCEVMLKDVRDSRRINGLVKEQKTEPATEQPINFSALILSANFWPTIKDEKMEFPEQMQGALDRFTKAFESLKGNRTLNWKPQLGMVEIEIELNSRESTTLKVPPPAAVIFWHFQDKASWTLEELSATTKMSTQAIRRKAAFWQGLGLLKEEPAGTLTLVENPQGHLGGDGGGVYDDDEEYSSAAHEARMEELQLIWQYVMGMLTNLNALSLDRIHAMLTMFSYNSTTTLTIEELRSLLNDKVKHHKLFYNNGMYTLKKS